MKCHAETGKGQRDERGEVLGEDRTQGRVRRRERLFEQIATEIVRAPAQLMERLYERDALEHERDADDRVPHDVVGPAPGVAELVNTLPDPHDRAE